MLLAFHTLCGTFGIEAAYICSYAECSQHWSVRQTIFTVLSVCHQSRRVNRESWTAINRSEMPTFVKSYSVGHFCCFPFQSAYYEMKTSWSIVLAVVLTIGRVFSLKKFRGAGSKSIGFSKEQAYGIRNGPHLKGINP